MGQYYWCVHYLDTLVGPSLFYLAPVLCMLPFGWICVLSCLCCSFLELSLAARDSLLLSMWSVAVRQPLLSLPYLLLQPPPPSTFSLSLPVPLQFIISPAHYKLALCLWRHLKIVEGRDCLFYGYLKHVFRCRRMNGYFSSETTIELLKNLQSVFSSLQTFYVKLAGGGSWCQKC